MADRPIFVFGSNLNGWHGKGAALIAKKSWGAIQGHGVGRQGDSYAIPTKGYKMETLPLDRIQVYVDMFIDHAREHKLDVFHVTKIGCGLAGYKDHQIAPLLKDVPLNCRLPFGWKTFSQLTDQNPEAFVKAEATELEQLQQYIRAGLAIRTSYEDLTWLEQPPGLPLTVF